VELTEKERREGRKVRRPTDRRPLGLHTETRPWPPCPPKTRNSDAAARAPRCDTHSQNRSNHLLSLGSCAQGSQ